MRTWLFYHFSAQMYFRNVKFQVVVAVGGIRTLRAHLVFYSQMDPFDVHIHIMLAAKRLITFGARNLGLRLDIGLATSSPQQVTFELFENFATELAGFQALVSVLSLPVGLHVCQKRCCIFTMRTLLNLLLLVSSPNVNG